MIPNLTRLMPSMLFGDSLNRDYGRDGKGGLFTIEHCRYDMRDIEIWYQANWYLDNIR